MTGSRAKDFEKANKAARLKDGTPDDYTWHHLDDFDPSTGKATLQLVKTKVHQKAAPHSGSVKQYEVYNAKEYKK